MKIGFNLKTTDEYIEVDFINGSVTFIDCNGIDRREFSSKYNAIKALSNVPIEELPELLDNIHVVTEDQVFNYSQQKEKIHVELKKEEKIFLDRIIRGEIKVTSNKVHKLTPDEVIAYELWFDLLNQDEIQSFTDHLSSGLYALDKYNGQDCKVLFSNHGKFYCIKSIGGKILAI